MPRVPPFCLSGAARWRSAHPASPLSSFGSLCCQSVATVGTPWPASTKLSRGIRCSVAHARYGHPLRFYIRPHFVKCSPVATLKLRLMSPTASRPHGFTKQALCKVAYAGDGRVSRRRSPFAFAPYAPPSARPFGCRGTLASVRRFAQCSGQWPAASHVVCAPARPPGPRRCAAWAPRAGCPSAPQGGSLNWRAILQQQVLAQPHIGSMVNNPSAPAAGPELEVLCKPLSIAWAVASLNYQCVGNID